VNLSGLASPGKIYYNYYHYQKGDIMEKTLNEINENEFEKEGDGVLDCCDQQMIRGLASIAVWPVTMNCIFQPVKGE
jgi:hypothetical protein